MQRMQLSLSNLNQFDFGKASLSFELALKRVVQDMLDRPGERKARTVTLTVSMTPTPQQDGDVVDAQVGFKITATTPAYMTADRPVMLSRQGMLIFQPDAPDNPHQSTLLDEDES